MATDIHHCTFPREWLIAWRDGALRGGPLEVTEAHLGVCAACRAWLREMDEIDALLRSSTPLEDDPTGRLRIKEHLDTVPQPAPARSLLPRIRPVLALPALLLLAVVVTIGTNQIVWGDGGLSRWIGAERTISRIEPTIREDLIPIPQATPAERTLPFGLGLVSDDDGRRTYVGDDGFAIMVLIGTAENTELRFGAEREATELIHVRGTPVILIGMDSIEHLIGATWEQDERNLFLAILRPPAGGLTVDDMRLLVAALMDEL